MVWGWLAVRCAVTAKVIGFWLNVNLGAGLLVLYLLCTRLFTGRVQRFGSSG